MNEHIQYSNLILLWSAKSRLKMRYVWIGSDKFDHTNCDNYFSSSHKPIWDPPFSSTTINKTLFTCNHIQDTIFLLRPYFETTFLLSSFDTTIAFLLTSFETTFYFLVTILRETLLPINLQKPLSYTFSTLHLHQRFS